MVEEGLVTLERVDILKYQGRDADT
jgi:hypothetical protein